MAQRKVKAGTSKASAADKRAKFVEAYITNGGNATEAAKTAGYSANSARSKGSQLLADVNISAEVSRRRAQELESAQKITGLTIERTLREIARIAYADPRKFYDAAGNLIPVHQLDDDLAACVASIEVDELRSQGVSLSITKKIKAWDKNAALEKAMKHLGQYELDNAQAGEALAKAFVYVPEKNGRRAANT